MHNIDPKSLLIVLTALSPLTLAFAVIGLWDMMSKASWRRRISIGAVCVLSCGLAYGSYHLWLAPPEPLPLTAEEVRRKAYHEAGHVVPSWHVRGARPVTSVTIKMKGCRLAATNVAPPRLISTEAELMANMMVDLGGYVAEELVFGSISTATREDIEKATLAAKRIVLNYGMHRLIGPRAYEEADVRPGNMLDRAINETVWDAHAEIKKFLAEGERRQELKKVAEALLARETLDAADLEQLLGKPQPLVLPPLHSQVSQEVSD